MITFFLIFAILNTLQSNKILIYYNCIQFNNFYTKLTHFHLTHSRVSTISCLISYVLVIDMIMKSLLMVFCRFWYNLINRTYLLFFVSSNETLLQTFHTTWCLPSGNVIPLGYCGRIPKNNSVLIYRFDLYRTNLLFINKIEIFKSANIYWLYK